MATRFEAAARRLAREIRARRLSLDPPKTQEEVAEEAGMSVRHYQQIEAGTDVNPRLETLFGIAVALGTTAVELLDPDRPTKTARRRAAKRPD